MDTLRMSKIVIEAESKIATLLEALGSGDNSMADWILTVLFGMLQDLERIAGKESVSPNIDKRELFETIDTALATMCQVRAGIDEHNYSLARTNSFLLHAIFSDLRELRA